MSLSVLDQMIVNNFPGDGIALMFGYGSQVIKQAGSQSSNDLIDIIIVVDDPMIWHQKNYVVNRQHYSFLKYLPNNISRIVQIQERFGAKVYFNPYVRLGTLQIKYGVIKTDHLIEDLLHWNQLYIAGRLQKPVELIVNTSDKNETLRSAMRFNKESAIRAALLQLPETFNTTQLYRTITGLSYHGDIRMMFGEDKNKIENIVAGQADRFNQMYLPTIKLNQSFKDSVHWNEGKQTFSQDLSSSVTLRNLKLLPRDVRKNICLVHGQKARTIDSDAVLASASRNIDCDRIVAQAIASIVRRSTLSQSFKGLFTAGFVKSLRYSQRKLVKSLKSRLN